MEPTPFDPSAVSTDPFQTSQSGQGDPFVIASNDGLQDPENTFIPTPPFENNFNSPQELPNFPATETVFEPTVSDSFSDDFSFSSQPDAVTGFIDNTQAGSTPLNFENFSPPTPPLDPFGATAPSFSDMPASTDFSFNPGMSGENNNTFSLEGNQMLGEEVAQPVNLDEIIPFESGVDIISLVDELFKSAIDRGASDIHIEPFELRLAVRFRVDGEFVKYRNFDIHYAESVLTRIEVLAGLKLDKNRLPQDGKIAYSHGEKRVDMRVSTFPTLYGNKTCIRLLVKENTVKTLDSLGYPADAQKIIAKNLDRTYGMILMTGPTGSGKSTTLFAMLSSYNPFEYNISTLEDPIEYFMPGVNQSQVNAEIGYDFPDGLRTLVRQDPDIIMVGEIRDKVTAGLAVNAAITGHLVFSTLHANSAAATIQRLMNMEVDHFLVISALNLIVSQRLVRKICPHCKEEFKPDEDTMLKVKDIIEPLDIPNKNDLHFYRGTGCEHCKNLGYKGRLAISEVLEMTPRIAKIVIEKRGVAEEVEKEAVAAGMITIKQNGILAAIKGETTLEEIFIASDIT